MIACTRCRVELAVDIDAVAGLDTPTGFTTVADFEQPTSPPSGEHMPLVIPPPPDCMMDPDDPDLLIHRGCATPDELAEDADHGPAS